jgi:hypothetical protein
VLAVASSAELAGPVAASAGLQQNKKPSFPKYQNPPAAPTVTSLPQPVYLYTVFNVIIGSGANRQAKLVVANYTGTTIPKGTTIYWSIIGQDSSNSRSTVGVQGSFPLQVELKPTYSTISPLVSLSPLGEMKEKKAWCYQ